MDILVELDRRSSQVEILAVELSTAVQAADLMRARRQLEDLRAQVELTATTLAVLIANAELVGLEVSGDDVLGVSLVSAEHASLPAPSIIESSMEVPTLAREEHALAERMIAVLVKLANLKFAISALRPLRFANGLLSFEEICGYVRDEIGRINAAWLWGKRTDAIGAHRHACAALRRLGEHRGVWLFLRDVSRLESDRARAAALEIAELLDVKLEVS